MANSANDLLDKIEDTVGPLGDDEDDEVEISGQESHEGQGTTPTSFTTGHTPANSGEAVNPGDNNKDKGGIMDTNY